MKKLGLDKYNVVQIKGKYGENLDLRRESYSLKIRSLKENMNIEKLLVLKRYKYDNKIGSGFLPLRQK